MSNSVVLCCAVSFLVLFYFVVSCCVLFFLFCFFVLYPWQGPEDIGRYPWHMPGIQQPRISADIRWEVPKP